MKSPASSTTNLKSLAFLCTVFSLSSLILALCSISAGAQTYPLQKGQKPIPKMKDQVKSVAIPDLIVVNGSTGWKLIPREGERVVDGNFHFSVRNIGTAPSPASLTRITCKPLTPGAKSCPKGMTGILNSEFLDFWEWPFVRRGSHSGEPVIIPHTAASNYKICIEPAGAAIFYDCQTIGGFTWSQDTLRGRISP